MSYALVRSRALEGLHAMPVQVEVQLANGLPSFTLVGLADTEVKEARERVRAALLQSGLAFPSNKRITVNLAPADLPKESGRFDLPIALGILAADGQLDIERLAKAEFAGELSLSGELRPVRGALALALQFADDPAATATALVLPRESAALAAQVPGLDVRAAAHLAEVVRAYAPGDPGEGLPRAKASPSAAKGPTAADLRDVKGQAAAKRALEVAAAGGHHLLLCGPPGSGKSMLAQRLPGLLPTLQPEEALAVAALQGLARDQLDPLAFGERPFRSPHHSASSAALVGGGVPPAPGEISLAHGGVLFLDELPEFSRHSLEALREPLENGWITIARAARRARFPARVQCVAAMNPCPCGWFGAPAGLGRSCRCTPEAIQRYQGRISGPLRDRFDIAVDVLAASPAQLLAAPDGEPSGQMAERVAAAQARQRTRQGVLNAALAPAALDVHAAMEDSASSLLQTAAQKLGWSARSLHRVLKLARTVADLARSAGVQTAHVAEAIQYRRRLEA